MAHFRSRSSHRPPWAQAQSEDPQSVKSRGGRRGCSNSRRAPVGRGAGGAGGFPKPDTESCEQAWAASESDKAFDGDEKDESQGRFRFGYVVHIKPGGCGYVTYDDSPTASHGVIFWPHWVQRLNLNLGDRLRYQIENKNGKDVAKDISQAPLKDKEPVAPMAAAISIFTGTITGRRAIKDGNATIYLVMTATGRQSVLPRKLYYGCWSPKQGDQVICTPREGKQGQRSSMDMRLDKPVERDDEEVWDFIHSLKHKSSNKDIQLLLSVPPAWAIVGQWPRLNADSLYSVVEFMVRVSSSASSYQRANLGLSLGHLMHERNFQLDRGACRQLFNEAASRNWTREKVSTLKSFCELVGQLVPERCYLIMHLCQKFYASHFTGHSEAFELAMLMCKRFLPKRTSDLSWHELPVTLNKEEIVVSADMREMIRLLPSVRTHAPYDSVADYLETNLKLLRADCFEKLRSGIQQFVGGTLNRRDMTVYHEVELRGIDITHRELSLVLKVKPFNREVKNWDKSPLLMFGNLLCLSFDDAFSEFVCVTVSNRDSDLLNNNGLIFAEPIGESNSIELSDLLRRLRVRKSPLWLAESPTYYQAYRHVLKNVQSLEGKKLPLVKELVSCDFDEITVKVTEELPVEAVSPESQSSLRINRLLFPFSPRKSLSVAPEKLSEMRRRVLKGICKELDASQKVAFKNCTRRRISIIQGPPGCGKTFVGTHLVRYLTANETRMDRRGPVLLVTYKNNALDEFIRKIVTRYDSQIDLIRLGGRSKKTELTKRLDIRSRRDTLPDEEAKDHWRLAEQSKRTLLMQLSNLFKMENVSFCANFLSVYWSEQNQDRFWRQFLQHPTCTMRRQGTVPPQPLKDRLGIALRSWIPNQQMMNRIIPAMLQSLKPNDGAPRSDNSKTPDANDVEEDEINDEQEQMKMERLLVSGGDSRSIENISLLLTEQEPSSLKLDLRLIQIVSERWPSLRYSQNLWELKPEDRFLFMQGCLLDHYEKLWRMQCSKLNSDFSEYERHRDELKEANLNRDVQICQSVDVIAMTITGASINNELLKRLRPNTVVVEEAAEIMEPMLLGCLGDWTERLYLIGDHKQLRPNVENFELVKHCHLDVSMMERLINCGFPFDCLEFQNRMRTDISKYLRLDVYPNLKDNEESVKDHQVPSFMPHAVAFWDVENMPESGERSYVNEGEAELTVQLAMTFLRFGYKPSQITILTPYQGQVRLIRQKLRPKLEKWKNELDGTSDVTDAVDNADFGASDGLIKVHSIDVYQGDENDIVLVSLVRSAKPGFLASLNRRCVAQSRSRCGLVFIGKASLLKCCPEWHCLLTAFEADGVLRHEFPVVCKQHRTEHCWRTAAELSSSKGVFCRSVCMQDMPCGKHNCPKKCQPWHKHQRCDAIVAVRLPCSHTKQIKCCDLKKPQICIEKCIKTLSCGHSCQLRCREICDSNLCAEKINIELTCGHIQSKLCNQPTLFCEEYAAKTLACGHVMRLTCTEWGHGSVKCVEQCPKTLSCGHRCAQKCFETCSENSCTVTVARKCITCSAQFESPCGMKKTQCDRILLVTLSCGHRQRTQCSQVSLVKQTACQKPCEKTLSCGHKCQFVCSKSPCPPCPVKVQRKGCNHECHCWELEDECLDIVSQKFECGHEEKFACCAASRLLEKKSCSSCWGLEKKLRLLQLQTARGNEIKRSVLTESDENTAVEYFKVYDRVMRYIKSEHSVTVTEIESIEKIENMALDRRLLDVRSQLVKKDSVPEQFFHGTRGDIAELIIKEGFKVGSSGMYGAGIYFATDTTKSVQYCRESGTRTLLLCDVLLGKTMVCDRPQNHLNLKAVTDAGYDSVFAKRNTKATKGVLNDEYIVYRPEQAAVRYLVKFK